MEQLSVLVVIIKRISPLFFAIFKEIWYNVACVKEGDYMGKTNEYFLIARNRLTNQFQVVPFGGKRGHSLEEIDLYTTDFKDEYELEDTLREDGVLPDEDTDFFIVHQRRANGEVTLTKQEALFSKHNIVRDIAENSRKGQITKSEYLIDHLLDSFADQMRRDPLLYERVVSGQTGIFEKYAKYFIFTRQNLSSMKYRDGGWARTSYPLIRNVVEATKRHNTRYAHISDIMYRSLLDEKLLDVTDPNYDPNQMSFFDMGVERPGSYDEDKLLEVMTSLEHLPSDTITIENGQASFNRSAFAEYRGNDLEKFMNLPQTVLLQLRLFFVQRDLLESACENGISQKRIRQGQQDMIQLLKNQPDLLDRVYNWCQLYHDYEGRLFGDNHGTEFQKRREDQGTK